ncbi:TetR family transcriptional regulator [Alteromonas sp. C1M14]|uniref:TetR family transcriptional regulator n=1 Tax=Alteromonas sp. C1M14 TaxID=2841567 RepID=UPI001C08FD05|nr:TetR family transcriptional regulator [Alteromonas sp. C1M14]MBU2980005.1 TetR family transcriptional regulator [Alteromonas sp. C1M14]
MRRTKEDAELTKQAILNAAVEVFTQRGVAKASLEEIARKAEVTRGAVYWHFKNKLEIFDALHQSLHTPFISRIMEGLEAEHPNPVGQLQELCTELFLELDHNEHLRKALTLFLLKCDYSCELESCKKNHIKAKKEKMAAFSVYFVKAMEAGHLPANTDPDILTLSVNCYLRGILIEYLEAPDSFNLTEKAPKLIGSFFSNLTPS